MADLNGWIKLHRQIMDWGWYSDPNTKAVFLHLLLTANLEDKEYLGHKISKGSTVIGLFSLSESLGLSVQQVRTALDKLERTGEITRKATNKFTVVTVENWELYQCDNRESNKQTTNEQQTDNNTLRKKEYKNIRNKEDIYMPYTEVVSYLNQKSGKAYRDTNKKTRELIKARVNEGYQLSDFQTVIDNKTKEWKGTKMDKFLRPETLFGTKFENYLNENPEFDGVEKKVNKVEQVIQKQLRDLEEIRRKNDYKQLPPT